MSSPRWDIGRRRQLAGPQIPLSPVIPDQENVIATHIVTHRPTPILAIPSMVLSAVGPVVSVYLTTAGAVPEASALVALRWRNMRRSLSQEGAAEVTLAAVDSAVADSYLSGETLAAIANHSGLLYVAHLPGAADIEHAVVSPVASLLPLLIATQPMLSHVLVITDRLGAELFEVQPDRPDLIYQVEGDDLDITRSAPRGWSQHRFQQRAENRWESNAGDVAHALTRLVDQQKPRLVAVCGDVRAVQFLMQQVPVRVADLITVIDGDQSHPEEALIRSAAAAAVVADADTAAVIADFNDGRPHGLAVTGSEATLSALSAGQVGVLLLDPTRSERNRAWCGAEPTQVAASAEALIAAGVADPQSAALADVAVRAALAADAQVRVVPAGSVELAPSGIGAVLRYQ
jgi:hypothetical protein